MKKILGAAVACVAALALTGCGSSGDVSSAPFHLTEDSGCVGYYTFDDVEDDMIPDHSGAGLDLYSSALDGVQLQSGKFGQGLYFDGSEYLNLDPEVLEGEGFTVSVWVKAEKWDPWARIFDFGNAKARSDIFLCNDMRAPGMIGLCIEGNGDPVVSCRSPIPVPGKWVHVAATFGNGKVAMYLDGKLTQELDTDVTLEEISSDPVGLYIGRSNWADPMFVGVMDDLLVFNHALSAKDVAALRAGIVLNAEEELEK